MRIAVDAMGGDFAPDVIIQGALLASEEVNKNAKIVLIGQEEAVRTAFSQQNVAIPSNIEIVDAPDFIEMGENPIKALQRKPQSSISVGYRLLKNKQIDAFCSAGNTGAMMVGSMFSVQLIPGIIRPVIMAYVPKTEGAKGIILDVGANTDCKPDILAQFAQLGSLFCQHVLRTPNPRVGLINLGEEEEKGNLAVKEAYKLLTNHKHLNFIGNVEGRDIFFNKADVLVCDGFIGNVIVKMAESMFDIIKGLKMSSHEFFDDFNAEVVGASPILGVNGNVVVAHGASNDIAIKNMILLGQQITESNITEKIKESFIVESSVK